MRQIEKIILFLACLYPPFLYGQRPREIQVDNEPPLWESPATVLVLIVIPLIMIIFGIIWYQKRKKKIHSVKEEIKAQEKRGSS
ncbi:MAG: hypothetical protein WDZ35_05625 [Crocinitomicaceae bacterium]